MAGRPENRSETRRLILSLPLQTHEYLIALAKLGKLGANEAAVAEHILTARTEEMMVSEYHKIKPPIIS